MKNQSVENTLENVNSDDEYAITQYGTTIKTERELELEEKRKFFHGEPLMNVLSKEEFQKRVEKVFDMVSNTLACSFGAYGSPVIISNYPFTHMTKDGFTIFKNMAFDAECGSLIDSVIADMIGNICGRLNYKVGDGTTTAIVATNSIYKSYYSYKNFFDENYILPRDIIKQFKEIKDELVEKIKDKAVQITDDKDTMIDSIRKVVRVSSNGDEKVTNMITEIYDKIGCPSISVELSKDNVTSYNIIDGYRGQVLLKDKIYINTDDGFCERKNIDVLMFDHKIGTECYEKIIRPVYESSVQLGRGLLVIAPEYSDKTMHTIIRNDMLNEYKKTKNIKIVIATCKALTASAKRNLADMAMLFNTTIIDKQLESEYLRYLNDTENAAVLNKIFRIINFSRDIKGIGNVAENDIGELAMITSLDVRPTGYEIIEPEEMAITLGFIRECRLGTDYSIFTGFEYDESLYKKFLDDAKTHMEEMHEKYAKMGTFNYEVIEATKRYNALKLETAVIEAGGDSEMSKTMLRDSIEDSIRAAESVYNNGYILGCNITTIGCITDSMLDIIDENKETDEPLDKNKNVKYALLNILLHGFIDVYRTILTNAYDGIEIEIDSTIFMGDIEDEETKNNLRGLTSNINTMVKEKFGIQEEIITETAIDSLCRNILKNSEEKAGENKNQVIQINLVDMLMQKSINEKKVFDLETKEFNEDIINSAATDIEVLTAIIDLMSMLITGNQLIIRANR